MLGEFVRDHLFTIAWFGLMAMVWFGWGQEDPRPSDRWKMGAGSIVGLALAGVFTYLTITNWSKPSALEGKYHWFGMLTGVEVLLAGVGCAVLWRRGHSRWMAWWVAVVVAAHFVPLAILLKDVSIAVAGIVLLAVLVLVLRRLRSSEHPTSRVVGPLMGLTLLAYAVVAGVLHLVS